MDKVERKLGQLPSEPQMRVLKRPGTQLPDAGAQVTWAIVLSVILILGRWP